MVEAPIKPHTRREGIEILTIPQPMILHMDSQHAIGCHQNPDPTPKEGWCGSGSS